MPDCLLSKTRYTRSGNYVLLTLFCVLLLIIVPGCTSESSGGGGNDQNDTSGNSQSPGGDTGGGGGDTGSSPGDPSPTDPPPGGSGGDTGGTGGGTGGDTGGGTGGDTGGGGGGDPAPIYGGFASLYEASNVDLTINSCATAPAISGSRGFSNAALRLVNQSGNAVNAAFTLTPNANLSSLVDQVFITIAGDFISQNVFNGTLSATYSLNGAIVAQASGTVIVNLIGSTSITVEFVSIAAAPDCSLVGGPFLMSERIDPADPGGGGGGDTGGGTGGDTGGGTGGAGGGTGGSGGSAGGTIIESTGQFGILNFTSVDFPDENATIDMTKVVYTTIPGFESFAWLNTTQQSTVNIYFGDDPTSTAITNRTTYSSSTGRSFDCFCFPSVDLINSEVIFNNIELSTRNGESLFISGVVAIPNLNQ